MVDTIKHLVNQYSLAAALVVFGATAHALAQFSIARKDETLNFDVIDFLIAIFICAFSGTIFGILASYLWDDSLVVHGSAGIGAFLGLKGLNVLSEIIIQIFKKGEKS